MDKIQRGYEEMIKVGSKCKIKGRPTRGVSFKVISIDKWQRAKIQHSISGLIYEASLYELELMK